MVVVKDILLRFREVGLDSIRRKFDGVIKSVGTLGQYGFRRLSASIDSIVDSVNRFRRQLTYVNLSFLSLLFGGLALQQMAVGLFRTFSASWMKIVDEINQARKQLTAMNASFEYMKFVIFDIFTSSEFFQKLVKWLTDAAEKIAEFAEAHPKLVETFGIFLALSFVIGSIMISMGSLLQTFYAFGAAISFILSPLGILVLALVAIALTSADMRDQLLRDFGVIGRGISYIVDGIANNDSQKFFDGLKKMFLGFVDIAFKVVGFFVKAIFFVLDWISEKIASIYEWVARLIESIPAPVKASLGLGGIALSATARAFRAHAKLIRNTFNPKGVDEALKSAHDLLIVKSGILKEQVKEKEREVSLLQREVELLERINELERSRLSGREFIEDVLSYRLSPEI